MVNKVILVGNVGNAPDNKTTQSGTAICNFSVATSESWTGADGQKNDKTEWHKIVAYKKLAEICGEYLDKGSKVYIEGKLQTRQWEDKEGQKRYTTEVVANSVIFLTRKEKGDEPARGMSQDDITF
jgi:single-strand DNA-binding protein